MSTIGHETPSNNPDQEEPTEATLPIRTPPTRDYASIMMDCPVYNSAAATFHIPRWMKGVLKKMEAISAIVSYVSIATSSRQSSFYRPSNMTIHRNSSTAGAGAGAGTGTNTNENESSSVLLWKEFLESRPMKQILKAKRPRALPGSLEKWQSLLRTACRLWREMERNHLLSIDDDDDDDDDDNKQTRNDTRLFVTNQIIPAMTILIKGVYYFAVVYEVEPTERGTYYSHERKRRKNRAALDRARKALLEEENEENLLHAVSQVSCPLRFVQLVLAGGMEESLLQTHCMGKTPLSVACSQRRNSRRFHSLDDAILLFNERIPSTQYKDSWIRLFCSKQPKCVLTPEQNSGFYPLHRACQSGYTWNQGLKEILKAAPHVVAISDSEKGLHLPFVYCALTFARNNYNYHNINHNKRDKEQDKDSDQGNDRMNDQRQLRGQSERLLSDSTRTIVAAGTENCHFRPHWNVLEHRNYHSLYPQSLFQLHRREQRHRKQIEIVETLYQLLRSDPTAVRQFR